MTYLVFIMEIVNNGLLTASSEAGRCSCMVNW